MEQDIKEAPEFTTQFLNTDGITLSTKFYSQDCHKETPVKKKLSLSNTINPPILDMATTYRMVVKALFLTRKVVRKLVKH